MKKSILALGLIIFCMSIQAQDLLKKVWYNGSGNVFSTTFGTDTIINKLINIGINKFVTDGSSSICDSNGNLVLCSDGFNLYDSNLNYIDVGDSLVPPGYYDFDDGFSSYSQSSIILPFDNKIYYLITATCSDSNLQNVWLAPNSKKAPFDLLLANKVDMNENAGKGKVVVRMKPIVKDEYISKTQMMACKHANGKDWWLLKMMHDSVSVYTFLVTKDSIYNYGKQAFSYPRKLTNGGYYEIMGQMQLSKDGTKFATTCNNGQNEMFVADFNRCTGLLSNKNKVNTPPLPTNYPPQFSQVDNSTTGLCFSSNSRYIYLIKYTNILQYDTKAKDSVSAWYHVATMDTTYEAFNGYAATYLAYNNRIYIGNWGHGLTSIAMSVINNPDVKGAGCNWCRKCLRFETLGGIANPPCQPNYDLGIDLSCFSIDTPVVSEILIYPNPVSETLNILLPSNTKNATVTIFNMLGKRVHLSSHSEIINDKIELSVRHLARALYSIKIVTDGEQFVGKFVRE